MQAFEALRSITRWQRTPVLATGFAELDDYLPSGGWPLGVLIEFLVDDVGGGELSLLLPAVQRAMRVTGWSHWINPPHLPYAPALAAAQMPLERLLEIRVNALKDQLWAMEQSLRSPDCTSCLAWCDAMDERWLRRLQLAAQKTTRLCVLWRSQRSALQRSPAALRLRLRATSLGLELTVLKARAVIKKDTLVLPFERLCLDRGVGGV